MNFLVSKFGRYGFWLVGLWTMVHIFLFWHFGIRQLFDARGYVQGADFLLTNGTFMDIHHAFYSIPIVCLAFFRYLFPNEVVPFLIFQCVVSGLATWALFKSATKLFNDSLAGFFSALVFLIWWDHVHWNVVTMTESLFRSTICFMIWSLVDFKGSKSDIVKMALLSVILLLIRPTGVIIILGVVVFCISYYWPRLRTQWVTVALIFATIGVLAYASANQLFSRWDFTKQYVKGNIVTYADHLNPVTANYESLRINIEHVEFDSTQESSVGKMISFVLSNPFIFLKAAALKIGFLVSGVRPYYSLAHNVYSLLWLLTMYGLCGFGWRNCDPYPIKLFVLIILVINCALIGAATVDWDNRFYIPMEPGIILLVGGGASALVRGRNLLPKPV
jgi:hypothetical protein